MSGDWIGLVEAKKKRKTEKSQMDWYGKKLEFIKISRNREIFKHFQPKNPHNLNF